MFDIRSMKIKQSIGMKQKNERISFLNALKKRTIEIALQTLVQII